VETDEDDSVLFQLSVLLLLHEKNATPAGFPSQAIVSIDSE
jgi:hypothetical protein